MNRKQRRETCKSSEIIVVGISCARLSLRVWLMVAAAVGMCHAQQPT